MWNPLSWVMEAATIMAIALANGGFLKNVQNDMLLKSRASNKSLLKRLFKHWMFSGMLHRNYFFIRISEKFRCVGFQDYVMRFITFIRPNQLVCLRLSLYIRMLYFIFWIF
ncbi:hypothetical protein CsatB_030792 [Cannabis sativa]